MDRGAASQADATRFAALARTPARIVLALVAAILLAAALFYTPSEPEDRTVVARPVSTLQQGPSSSAADGTDPGKRDDDLALYDAITARVAAGENYYRVAVEEQRARNFPVRPGFAVRLPTLATVSAAIGPTGIALAALLLAAITAAAWWVRLTPILDRPVRRVMAVGLLAVGAAVGFKPIYFVLHEAWAGMLLALALALHRPGKWRGAWVAAALALAIREHALPFVLLMGALAAWRREWRELAFWGLLVAAFLTLLAWHVQTVAVLTGPDDPLSSSWLTLRGPNGWLEYIILCSGLYLIPQWLGAPLALLPLLGWAALRRPLGLEAFLLFAGYGLLFMLAGRANNFYWGLMVTPAWFVGIYWVPFALRDLLNRARGRAT
ncbi:hypothetical protein [Qipengyuania oceanensis]|uniref:DUF2029 domain-containing protein n=1 Tax=Qipengyuania oceanensis TaxID=1463597 RepID=A0A844YI08_9SPHN|nr:hypothetical protein [Qipengyuania oceanensis]MXO63373.1 hypothetical protein [Qipengyuania oceanensis]